MKSAIISYIENLDNRMFTEEVTYAIMCCYNLY